MLLKLTVGILLYLYFISVKCTFKLGYYILLTIELPLKYKLS